MSGELNDVVPPLLAPLKTIADKLTVWVLTLRYCYSRLKRSTKLDLRLTQPLQLLLALPFLRGMQ